MYLVMCLYIYCLCVSQSYVHVSWYTPIDDQISGSQGCSRSMEGSTMRRHSISELLINVYMHS